MPDYFTVFLSKDDDNDDDDDDAPRDTKTREIRYIARFHAVED